MQYYIRNIRRPLALRTLVVTLTTLVLAGACNEQDPIPTGVAAAAPSAPRASLVGANVVVLPTLGGVGTDAFDINDAGQVVGSSYTAGNAAHHAFLWTPTHGIQDLGSLGGLNSTAYGINELGQVVGMSDTPASGVVHAFLWTQESGMQDLGTLGSDNSAAMDINDVGQAVGRTSSWDGINYSSRAVLWTPGGGIKDLGSFGGSESSALAINNAGQVVGYSQTGPRPFRAFLWTATGGMRDLGTVRGPDGTSSSAADINELGQVVGSSAITDFLAPSSLPPHAFFWTPGGGMQDLSMFAPDYFGSSASAINDLGQVVGVSSPNVGPSFRFVWTAADGMVDIGPTTGMTSVAAINNHGQVVGGDRVATLQFQLTNHAPVAFTGGPYITTEGTPIPISLSATDADGDALTYWWDFFDGDVTGKGPSPPKTFGYVGDNGTATISLMVWDSKGGSDRKATTVTVLNVAPTIPVGGLVGPATPIQLIGGSASATLQLSFTDPGWGDMHTAAIECGNGTTTLSPERIETRYTITSTCTYTSPGVYTVRATVTDDDGATSAPAFFRYVIVYDPNGAFATGSGFYTVSGQTRGKASKAHFTFSAEFLPGQTVPNGTARFWIPGGQLDFQSTGIEMLIVSGNRAQFWGAGTLNGAPARFRITAVAGGNKDAFRIELWQAGAVVFDSQLGDAQDAPVTTEVDGGNIQIGRQ